MIELRTERLRLIPLTQKQLYLYLQEPQQLERELGFPLSRNILSDVVRGAIRMKLSKMARAEAEQHSWYTYWLVAILAQPFGAGLAGFKGVPNERGEVEIGYGIDPVCQGRGYITEAARALIDWAFQSPRCRAIIAPGTRKENKASNRILEKLGMQVYDETEQSISWRIEKPDPVR